MPIDAQSDNETFTPVLETTVDASGKELISTAIPLIDPHGRFVNADDLKHKPEDIKEAEVAGKEAEKKEKTSNPEAEARKLFLQAQKAQRSAIEMEKKAKAGLAKATAIEKAVEMTKNGEDPTAVLTAIGVDPIEFYKKMTTYALKGENKQEDPVQKELREHKERLDQYAKNIEVQAQTLKEKEDIQIKNNILSTQIIPLLQANTEKYESLMAEYGPNAAIEVLNAVYAAYELPDDQKPEGWKMPTFEEAADKMEEYWSSQIESGLNKISNMKKFAARFAQAQQQQEKTPQIEPETPRRSQTLSNKQTVSAPTTQRYDRYMSSDERAAELIKRLSKQ